MKNRIAGERPSRLRARFRACWVTQVESGCAVEGLRWIRRHPELDEHEDAKGAQPGGLDGEEVARDDVLRLGPQELAPGWTGPSRGWTEPDGPEQGPDRRRADADPELAQLALDPDAPPAWVLLGEPQDNSVRARKVLVLHLPRMVERVESRVPDQVRQRPGPRALRDLTGVVRAHCRDVTLSVLAQPLRRERGFLGDPDPDLLREVLALDADRVADDAVAVATSPPGGPCAFPARPALPRRRRTPSRPAGW